jgi:hypothetical protein
MTNLRIGLRRLYKAVGVDSTAAIDVDISRKTPDGLTLRIYIGANPPFGAFSYRLPPYGFVGATLTPEPVSHGAGTYVLLSVTWPKDASAKKLSKIRANAVADQKAYFDEIDSRKAECQRVLDATAGMLGLRLARQYVMEPVDESPYLDLLGEGRTRYESNGTLVLARMVLNAAVDAGSREVVRLVEGMTKTQLETMSVPLHWLVKAWRERDDIARFVYMFIPLESVLPRPERNLEIAAQMDTLKSLVDGAPEDTKQRLGTFMQIIENKMTPSLVDRFTAVARKHFPDDSEIDLAAFRKFYKMRNDLVHRGKKAVSVRVDVEQETRTLQQLAEKYIRAVHLATLGSSLDVQ